MTSKRAVDGEAELPSDALMRTQRRIDEQRIIVDGLAPGSEAHRQAVQILFLYEDSLHVLSETRDLIRQLNEAKAKGV